MDLQTRAEKMGADNFYGVPVKDFAFGGREQLIFMLTEGLSPDSKVVDLGCGVLRAGYWLVNFLKPGCYFGIEPHTGRLQMGKEIILGTELLETKRPTFDSNEIFDTSVFGKKFDFFLAYSIWTHGSKSQIRMTLDSFIRDSTKDGVFLATYLPSSWRNPDYQADEWFGTSHKSDKPGCIHHSLRWIKAECAKRGLAVSEVGRDKTHGQYWLKIRWN